MMTTLFLDPPVKPDKNVAATVTYCHLLGSELRS